MKSQQNRIELVSRPASDPLVHGGIFLAFLSLDVQELDQRLDGDPLDEDGPIDNGNGGCHEHS